MQGANMPRDHMPEITGSRDKIHNVQWFWITPLFGVKHPWTTWHFLGQSAFKNPKSDARGKVLGVGMDALSPKPCRHVPSD